MATRKPLIYSAGRTRELPNGDILSWPDEATRAAQRSELGVDLSLNAMPSDHNLKAWVCDPALAQQVNVATSGRSCFTKIRVPLGQTIASALLDVSTAGSGLTYARCALYSLAGAQLAVTASETTTFNSGTGNKEIFFATPWVATASLIYVAWLFVGTTPPTLRRGNSTGTGINLGLSATDGYRCGELNSQSSLPATVDPTTFAASGSMWCTGLR